MAKQVEFDIVMRNICKYTIGLVFMIPLSLVHIILIIFSYTVKSWNMMMVDVERLKELWEPYA